MVPSAHRQEKDVSQLSIYMDFRARPGVPPRPADFEDGITLVRAAERLGFGHVWTTEQHGVDDGYLPAQLPMLAALARETSRIRLGTAVILLPLTHPRRVVEEACLVDVLSHGRLTLGLGAGNYPGEFAIFGADLADRGRAMEDGVAFVKAGLSGGGVLPDGAWVNVPPVQRPVPLVLGGLRRPAVERAARHADGHFAYAYLAPERELPRLYRDVVRPAMEQHQRGPGNFRLIFAGVIWASDDAGRQWRETVGPAFAYQQRKYQQWEGGTPSAGGYAFTGDLAGLRRQMLIGRPVEVAERLLALREAYPFDEAVIWPRLPGVPLGMALEHLEVLAAEVAPALAGPRR
jgi:alkanesulfonate monooxygenase SsuD/methylene tetrahydromethanopterin reductase-like flavin-dependent oxidoreductase (luciferase family)